MSDALVYSKMVNNVTDQESLQYLANQLNISSSSNINDIKDTLNNYLVDTTIKRACCLGRQGLMKGAGPLGDGTTGINVKLPIPSNYDMSLDANKNLETQYQYIEKTVFVPQELCDADWSNPSTYCDSFMNVYCANQKKIFTDLNKGVFDPVAWPTYSKECSCYAPPNPSYASAPHICYMNGCIQGDNGVYVDPSSRNSQCDMTVCTAIVTASGIQAGGWANFSPQIQQNCGKEIAIAEEEHNAAEKAAGLSNNASGGSASGSSASGGSASGSSASGGSASGSSASGGSVSGGSVSGGSVSGGSVSGGSVSGGSASGGSRSVGNNTNALPESEITPEAEGESPQNKSILPLIIAGVIAFCFIVCTAFAFFYNYDNAGRSIGSTQSP